MTNDLKQLVELSNLNKEIDAYAPQIEQINTALASKHAQIDQLSKKGEKVAKEIGDLQDNILSTNAKIAEFKSKIADVAKKTGAVQTEKEAAALETEEGLARDQLSSANDDIVRYERMIESKNELLSALEGEKTQAQNELDELKAKSDEALSVIEKGRKQLTKRKEELVATCDQKLVVFYEKIRKWAKNTAVVPVRKQACYGCFMKISDKTYNNIQHSDEVVTCPHCGRILFKEESEK